VTFPDRVDAVSAGTGVFIPKQVLLETLKEPPEKWDTPIAKNREVLCAHPTYDQIRISVAGEVRGLADEEAATRWGVVDSVVLETHCTNHRTERLLTIE
jgi:hypothetical protein